MKKKVIFVATLDTKGEETKYIKDVLERSNLEVLMVDSGILGEATHDIAHRVLDDHQGAGRCARQVRDGPQEWVQQFSQVQVRDRGRHQRTRATAVRRGRARADTERGWIAARLPASTDRRSGRYAVRREVHARTRVGSCVA